MSLLDNKRAMATLLLSQLPDENSNIVLLVAIQYLSDKDLNDVLEFALIGKVPEAIKNGKDIMDKLRAERAAQNMSVEEVSEMVDDFLFDLFGGEEEED